MEKAGKIIYGWGNFPSVKAEVVAPASIPEVQQIVQQYPQLIARGGGNSYGDSSLQQVVLSTNKLTGILAEGKDWIEVQAGLTIDALLQHIVPQKKFLPVTPGTKAVTIGGAIAADVHGKNHVHAGSFFNTVQSLQVVVVSGELVSCSLENNEELFYSCFGGMGLQGIIVSAVIRLMPLPSEWMIERQYFADSVAEMFSLMLQHRQAPYLVGWIDLLSKDTRGIVKTGEWAADDIKDSTKPTEAFITIPFRFPIAPPRFLFQWYNKRYLKKALRQPVHHLHYNAFFYPLDSIKNWQYVFGRKGLLQYHFVLPLQSSETGITAVIDKVKNADVVCTLAVLKLFGKGNQETPQAFATEGFNLALDFIRSDAAIALIKELDVIVQGSWGQIYKAKDAVSGLPTPLESGKFQSIQNERYGRK